VSLNKKRKRYSIPKGGKRIVLYLYWEQKKKRKWEGSIPTGGREKKGPNMGKEREWGKGKELGHREKKSKAFLQSSKKSPPVKKGGNKMEEREICEKGGKCRTEK